MTATITTSQISPSFTTAMSAGARSPLTYVNSARTTKAMISATSGLIPMLASTTLMPKICSAMYGIVATSPVRAMSSAKKRLSKRSFT